MCWRRAAAETGAFPRTPDCRPAPQGQTRQLLEPRPKVSDYWARMKARPSYQQVFGPALNGKTAACQILPALLKAFWGNLTGGY